jgi:2-succinyl-6-hydroxy-2,4-cyclohexadiene-1-carboxylate synthase
VNYASINGAEWSYEWRGNEALPVLALLHGFAGTRRTWDALLPHIAADFHLLLIDLPGHGGTPLPERDITLRELGMSLGETISALSGGAAMICGYSMGGRVALHTALFFRQAVSALILLGASPGIEDPHERKERRQSDHKLAENILQSGSEWFADYWGQLALFASQKNLPESIQKRLRESRVACDPHGLAYCLRNFGTGEQEFLGSELHRLSCPMLLMAGALDEKFARLNQYMLSAIGTTNVRAVEILSAGHAGHVENPQAVAREIISFSENLRIES